MMCGDNTISWMVSKDLNFTNIRPSACWRATAAKGHGPHTGLWWERGRWQSSLAHACVVPTATAPYRHCYPTCAFKVGLGPGSYLTVGEHASTWASPDDVVHPTAWRLHGQNVTISLVEEPVCVGALLMSLASEGHHLEPCLRGPPWLDSTTLSSTDLVSLCCTARASEHHHAGCQVWRPRGVMTSMNSALGLSQAS